MGAVGSAGPANVTLQFAIARRGARFCATVRELNLAPADGRPRGSLVRLQNSRRLCPVRVARQLSAPRAGHESPHEPDFRYLYTLYAISRACELPAAWRIRGRARRAIAALDLDNQAHARRVESAMKRSDGTCRRNATPS